jgi:CPA1 family monovalent cation:H+ antiporter
VEATGIVLISLLAVVLSGFVSRITRLPLPLVQIALGAAIWFTRLDVAVLDPDVYFLLFLPPLLFLDGWRIPNQALVQNAATVLPLALGLVLFTVLGMGWFIHWLIPALPLTVAFALAAVISPTDPIAVSAIAARTPLPARLMHILQGESLFNDASGLVCLRFAVAATLTGSFSLSAALLSFSWVALGGLAIGGGVTWLLAKATAWAAGRFGEDGGAQILTTLLIPFGVYLLAERLHCSGILAAVAAGVTMSLTDLWPWRAAIRLRRTAVWDTVQLVANGSIFVLLGEQLPALVVAMPQTVLATGHSSPWWLALYGALIMAALVALRFAWVWVALRLSLARARRRGGPLPDAGWRVELVMSLAGVRGAVTLAGVLTLPAMLHDGTPFPGRDLAVLLAAGVIVLSLLLATLALPHALRGLATPTPAENAQAERSVRTAAAHAAVAALHAALRNPPQAGDAQRRAEAAAALIALYRQRIGHLGGGKPRRPRDRVDDVERELRLLAVRAERAALLRPRRGSDLDEASLRAIVRELDFQEARFGG